MYITDNTGDLIEEYTLSFAGDIATASHAGSNLAIADAQTDVPEDMAFNADGTKMYLVDRDGDAVLEYTLSTAYDISTASYDADEDADVSGQTDNPEDIFFSSDGLKMFILENQGANSVLEYALGTAYDVSDETYTDAFTITGYSTSVDAMEFSPDGKKLFLAHNKGVNQYALGPPWDVSTATVTRQFDLSDVIGSAKGLAFSPDGKQMFITGTSRAVHQFNLELAWELFESPKITKDQDYFPPHLHDEIKISLNSEEPIIVHVKDNEIKNIQAHVGDTVDVILSVGDDKYVDGIDEIKFITNYANTPSDMNKYFITNYNDYNQVGLSIYEWYQNRDDIKFDYDETISWNESITEIKQRTETYHAYEGPLLIFEKELLVTYSMNMNKEMPQTQVGLKIVDIDNNRSDFILPFTLEVLSNDPITIIEETR